MHTHSDTLELTSSQLKDEDDPQKLQKSVKKLSLKKLTR